MPSWTVIFSLFAVHAHAADLYLRNYGAHVAGEWGVDEAQQNGEIFHQVLQDADSGDRVILSSGEYMYYIPHAHVEGLHDVSVVLDGSMILHDNISAWPYVDETESYMNAIEIRSSTNVTITGRGVMDGQGMVWWVGFLNGDVSRRRPTMIEFQNSIDILIENVNMLNGPRFHIYCDNVLRLEVRYMTIWVDMHGIFPFNTDGVDFSGKDIYVHDMLISNFDDSVCVKPSRETTLPLDGEDMTCSENVLVENIEIHFGAGLSIGSVPSSKNNCVRNVTFQNIHASTPLKFIYVKTGNLDNATDITGTIDNITYRNMTATGSLLWPIYIGPQQQKEPDGTGAGIWPAVNPYVTITNVRMENIDVKMTNRHVAAGVLRCSSTNPGTGITFRNVVVDTLHRYTCSEPGSLIGSYDSRSHPDLELCGLELSP